MIKFIKKEFTGSYVEGKMFKTTVISKKEAVKLINENMGRLDGEMLIDDLILQGQGTVSTVSNTYLLPDGLEVGIQF